jgi:hypothetical protein
MNLLAGLLIKPAMGNLNHFLNAFINFDRRLPMDDGLCFHQPFNDIVRKVLHLILNNFSKDSAKETCYYNFI